MSKHINVNPDHYKTAGRDRPGDAVAQARKPAETGTEESRKRWEKRQKKKTGRQK
jgi:hypothetical protein